MTCSKLRRKTPEQHQWRHSGVFILNSKHILHLVLALLLLTLYWLTCWSVSVNLSKDSFYFTYSDNKKQVRINFMASSLSGFSIVTIFLASLGIPGNLYYSPDNFSKSISSRRSCTYIVFLFGTFHLFYMPTPWNIWKNLLVS